MGLSITWDNLDINSYKKVKKKKKKVKYWVLSNNIYVCLRFHIFYLPYENCDIKKDIWKLDLYFYLDYFSSFFYLY